MNTSTVSGHPDAEERLKLGRQARMHAPLSSQADWQPPAERRDPVELLVEQNAAREPDLVPVRHGRMMVSPFTFYRGAAKVMAADLAGTATAGLEVQLCGDAHLSNFGGFASPERQLLFGLNDFDETLPGPFEYDLKRLAASFTIAARNNGFNKADTRAVTVETVQAYRLAMTEFAAMPNLDIWYAHMSEHHFREALRAFQTTSIGRSKKKGRKAADKDAGTTKAGKAKAADLARAIKTADKALRKARSRDSLHALPRFAELVDGTHRIVSQPPVVVPLRELGGAWGLSLDGIRDLVQEQFRTYLGSLSADRRHLLERFTIIDMARKVVGVGSVGTRSFIVLLQGRDIHDPLFLQVKEATASVLEDHLPKTRYQPGRRVVEGQRLMQPASDIFLGWTTGVQDNRFFYWRQLRDMKVSPVVETMSPSRLTFYARVCGWTLAHAHARSGDPIAIAEYLGQDANADRAIATFAKHYADQNERDYASFVNAVADGRIEAIEGV